MKEDVLYFDKRKVLIDEMIEHYNFYITLVNEGISLLDHKDKKGARDILKIITDGLKLESNYYEKGKVKEVIRKVNDSAIIDYCQGVYEAYIKVYNANSYSMLHSNLYDVEYYLKYWFKKHLRNDI